MTDTMKLLYNPGVKTAYDREQAYRTLTCPFCGAVEPNEFLLANNHWLKRPEENPLYDWCESHGMCIAQNLTTNHIGYYAKGLRDRDPNVTGFKKFKEDECRRNLADACQRGEALGIDAALIVSWFIGVVCAQCAKGEHSRCLGPNTWSTVANDAVDCTCKDCGEDVS
jgi:hypothetical protein